MSKEDKQFNISISAGTIVKAIVILVVAAILYKMMDLVLVVLTAVVIASSIEPIIKYLGRYKINRLFSVIISFVVVISIFAGLLYSFVPSILDEASGLLNSAPKYLDTLTLWNPLNDNALTQTGKMADSLAQGLSGGKQIVQSISDGSSVNKSVISDMVNQFRSITSGVSGGFVSAVSGVFGGILSFILIVVLSFYLSVQEGGVERFLRLITPMKNEKYILDLWRRSQIKIGYYMQGQLLLGLLVGLFVYLGLMILGVKNALLLAVLAACMEIIPLFGPIIAAVPAVLSAAMDSGITMGLVTTGLYIIIHQFENHLLYPLVVRKVVGVSPIVVILSIIVGYKLAGFLGIILSVPITSILMEYLDDVQKDKTEITEKIRLQNML
ncbi:MAG: AI-2E family transporter [bacterium]